MQNKKLEEMSVIELESLIYRQLRAAEQIKINIQLLEQELNKRPKEEVKNV